VSGRSDLDAVDDENGRSDTPMDVAIEMSMAATAIAAETTGSTKFEPMERKENGKQTRRSETPAAHNNWGCCMERTIRQQAQELTQVY